MLKNTCIFVFILFTTFAFAQTDSVRHKNFNHFAGIDFGYTSYDKVIGFKGETNINYVFNPYYFCAKIQLGISPGTNFGTLKKGVVSIGFSTKTNKFLSWHLLTGTGIVEPSNTYIEPPSPVKYVFYLHSLFLESGFYLRPIKNKRVLIGLNSVVHRVTVSDNAHKYPPIHGKPTLNINLSINIKLNK